MQLPLHEFDPNPIAVINPSRHARHGTQLPERGVLCWFGDVVGNLMQGRPVAYRIPFEHGAHRVVVIEHDGVPVALANPGVGAPASASSLEVLIALGCTSVVAVGGAGVIRPGFDVGHVVVPTGAVRDEGTSYHYAPHDVDVAPHADALVAIEAELAHHGVPYDRAMTWTTDAFFRETEAKVARRREQGCLTVEMEAAALFAVAAFRGARFGQLLYCGDDVSATEWDHRGWTEQTSVRERLLTLALGAVSRM